MRLIDVRHLGRPRVVACGVVDDVLIDPGPTSCVQTLLAGLEGLVPRAVLLTHIHLDHAGATGSLVERWPGLEVYVHERGAPHLIDPSRLLSSASRLYGEEMDTLWGEMVPVPERNLRVLQGGERVLDDAFEVAYTPGHAWHHVAYRCGAAVFAGDTGGVRIAERGLTIPPTPPPDIDLAAWHESIERISAWRPERLAITHFGLYNDAERQLGELAARLDEWADWAREENRDAFIDTVRATIEGRTEAEMMAAYLQAAPPQLTYAGLERYWRKQAEAVPPAAGPPVS